MNVGSIAAFSVRPNGAAYATSKAALQGLTRSLALDGRAFGIAVGAINPGNVLSELLSPEEVARRRVSEGLIAPEDVATSVMTMVSSVSTCSPGKVTRNQASGQKKEIPSCTVKQIFVYSSFHNK